MLSVTLEGFPKRLDRHVQGLVNGGFGRGTNELLQEIRVTAPKDLGGHASGYAIEPAIWRDDGSFKGALVNNTPNSLFRERGRPPGRQPPISAVEGWAKRRGLSPYLVARGIAKRGTARWRENDNPLGIDRASVEGNIILKANSIVNIGIDKACELASDWEV